MNILLKSTTIILSLIAGLHAMDNDCYPEEIKSKILKEDLGGYEISHLTQGIYRALKTDTGDHLILKPIKNNIEPFGKEEKILTKRGLLKGIFSMNNKDYLLMPYFNGQRLNDFLKYSDSSLRIKGLINLCHELSKLHDLNIIHGDMHSGNYLINSKEAFIFDHDWSIILEEGTISCNTRPSAVGAFPPDTVMTKGWDIWMLGDSFAFAYNDFLDCATPIFNSTSQILTFYSLISRMKIANAAARPTARECKETLERINSMVIDNPGSVDFNYLLENRAPVTKVECIVM